MAETVTMLGARLQRLSSERARLIEQLRREEWKFEKELSMKFVLVLGQLRARITEKEMEIVRVSAQMELLKLATTAAGYSDLTEEMVIS